MNRLRFAIYRAPERMASFRRRKRGAGLTRGIKVLSCRDAGRRRAGLVFVIATTPARRVNPAMEIRDAVRGEAEEMGAVLRRSIVELCAADHQNDPASLAAWLSNKTPASVGTWMERADASYLVATEHNVIAAVGAVTDRGEILLNYVSPHARFRGASQMLLAALEIRAAEKGATHCVLESTETAHRFYRSRGYTDVGLPTRKFGMESGYRMVKALPFQQFGAQPP